MSRPHRATLRPAPSRGLGSIAVLVVLVVLASLAAALVRLGHSSQSGLAQAVLGTRAAAAARAGTEWGLYQALRGSWTTCSGASQTLDLGSDTGMHVSVSCSSTLYNEGESAPGVPLQLRLYTIDAVACNSASCPDNASATQPGYIERRQQVQAVK